jgi:exonuclease 3'-5' domain-containing protein 1
MKHLFLLFITNTIRIHSMSSEIVDTVEKVRQLIFVIETTQPQPPFLFIDLEGVNLSRQRSVAIMQILVPPQKKVYLLDVHVLKGLAFNTPGGANGLTLKDVLESDKYAKVFFDVRNDSDALHAHYQIKLRGVVDLQVMESATRNPRGKFLKGLAKCIGESGGMGAWEQMEWQRVKNTGVNLFAPEKGGRYVVFQERPLSPVIAKYCAQDVLCMPALLQAYARKLRGVLAMQVQQKTVERIASSQSPTFNGKGQHMALGPKFSSIG